MIVQFRNEKVSNHGSIPITIDCNVVAIIVFEEGFHQPIKRTKQLVAIAVEWLRYRTCGCHVNECLLTSYYKATTRATDDGRYNFEPKSGDEKTSPDLRYPSPQSTTPLQATHFAPRVT
ncbi:hypothetical protein TNCV_4854821 [Trichonephila clavipes]|nr:hypothetical protein TNCV_4854821 [Trichonephila clavipes]